MPLTPTPLTTDAADGFVLTCDPARIDRDRVHELVRSTYWAEGIPRETMDRAVDNSLVFGVLDVRGAPRLVGVARVMSDYATFAYLADVFIEPACRGLGLSVRLMRFILSHPDLQGLRRFCLLTRDAHGLYERFGFANRVDSGRGYMEITRPGMYLAPGVAPSAGEPA
jgi:N-acetylglutamate synthase-like GNAT family acetyltransferase